MRLLITGANGQLGRSLSKLAANVHDVLALTRNELDITDAQSVKNKISEFKPDIVINAAAYTAVDKAETEREQAFLANKTGPENLARTCGSLAIPMVHVSTDYVFDGSKTSPYNETDPANPMGVYGESKFAGEEAVRNDLQNHIILRVSWVFGLYGHNFVKTIQRLAREREELKIVNDQYGCPTSTENIAKVILQICDSINKQGFSDFSTYHYCDAPDTTWFEFANTIVEELSKYEQLQVKRVLPITTEEFPLPARRPQNSRMDCSKLKNIFQIEQYSWRNELEKMIKELAKQ